MWGTCPRLSFSVRMLAGTAQATSHGCSKFMTTVILLYLKYTVFLWSFPISGFNIFPRPLLWWSLSFEEYLIRCTCATLCLSTPHTFILCSLINLNLCTMFSVLPLFCIIFTVLSSMKAEGFHWIQKSEFWGQFDTIDLVFSSDRFITGAYEIINHEFLIRLTLPCMGYLLSSRYNSNQIVVVVFSHNINASIKSMGISCHVGH